MRNREISDKVWLPSTIKLTHINIYTCRNKEMSISLFLKEEFAKSRAKRASVPTWSTRQRVCVLSWFMCKRACVPPWFTCQSNCVPTCQKCANSLFLHTNMPTCHEACQCFNLACQCAKWCANFSTWCTNVPKVCQSFKHSCYEMLKEISILYHYIKNSTYHSYTYHMYMYHT